MALQKKKGGGHDHSPVSIHDQQISLELRFSRTHPPPGLASLLLRGRKKNSRRIPGAEEEVRWMPSMLDGAEEEEEGRLGEKRVSK